MIGCGFNEAAGIHRRKRLDYGRRFPARVGASMRPPEFTGGNEVKDSMKEALDAVLQ